MRPKLHRAPLVMLALVILSLFVLVSCGVINKGNPLEPTLTALNASVAQTMTAVKQEDVSNDTLATEETFATAEKQVVISTQTAEVIAQEQNQEATAAAAAPVLAELPQYGIDPASGQVGWIHDPLDLKLTGYHDFAYGNDHMNVTAADFVLASDITWDTQYGGSGCGFMFRSNGNKNKPDQYMVLATRFATGHVVFLATKDGEIANFHDFYPKTEDRSFQIENGTTNRLAVVARGNIIEIYTNGIKIGEVDTTKPPVRPALPAAPKPPADLNDIPGVGRFQTLKKEYDEIAGGINSNFQVAMKNYQNRKAIFTEGFLAMLALSESGETNCNFDNTWLWLIEP
jgi:hypothetical protein